MYVPVGRTESEVSSLRHLLEPSLRLRTALVRWTTSFRADTARGATLFTSALARDQAERWLHDYTQKILELATDAALEDRKAIDLMARPYHRHHDMEATARQLPSLRELETMDTEFLQRLAPQRMAPTSPKISSAAASSTTPAATEPSSTITKSHASQADEDEDNQDGGDYSEAAPSDGKKPPPTSLPPPASMAEKSSQILRFPKTSKASPLTALDFQHQVTFTSYPVGGKDSKSLLPSLDTRAISYRNGLFYSAFVWCLWGMCEGPIVTSLNHHLVETYVSAGYDSQESLAPVLRDVFLSVSQMLLAQTRGKTQSRVVYLLRWFDSLERRTDTMISDYLKGEALAWMRCSRMMGCGDSEAFRWDFVRQQLSQEEKKYWKEHEEEDENTWPEKAAGYPHFIKEVRELFEAADLDQFPRFISERSSVPSTLPPPVIGRGHHKTDRHPSPSHHSHPQHRPTDLLLVSRHASHPAKTHQTIPPDL